MGENSHIEWTDHTWNPWIGCTKVSPGCQHCYAETLMDTRYGRVKWGKGQPRVRTSAANWKLPLRWEHAAEIAETEWQGHRALNGTPYYPQPRRPRVFCASLADWLDEEVPAAWLFDLISLIHKTPSLDWLLLTKRPENFESRLRAAAAQCTIDPLDITDRIHSWLSARPEYSRIPHNVWIGTTVEDQTRAEERIPHLLRIPAKVRFLSCEPLLGPVDLKLDFARVGDLATNNPNPPLIHWVIAGGESGQHARPMKIEWAEGIFAQCSVAGVPFFMKQMGGTRKPFPSIPEHLNVRQFPR